MFTLCAAAAACSDGDDDGACTPSNLVDDAEIVSTTQSLSSREQALLVSALGLGGAQARARSWSAAGQSDERALVRDFVETLLIDTDIAALPRFAGGAGALRPIELSRETRSPRRDSPDAEQVPNARGEARYLALRRVLVAGDLVLTRSEGERAGRTQELYDLFRVARGRVVERWRAEWPATPSAGAGLEL